jgi:membrane protein implicated in regulation of membrane protease activity
MAEISVIVLTLVVAVLALLLWRLVRAIERREAQFDRRDQQFEQALRQMHDLTAAVRKLVDVILTRWGTPLGAPAEQLLLPLTRLGGG